MLPVARIIRPASLEDVKTVAQLNQSSRNEPDGTVGIEYLESDFQAYLGKDHIFFFVAEVDNCVVGFILAFDHGNWGYVDVLCVHPEARSHGLGTELLGAVESIGVTRHWGFIELCRDFTDTQIGAYVERRGYVDVGSVQWYGKLLTSCNEQDRANWIARDKNGEVEA